MAEDEKRPGWEQRNATPGTKQYLPYVPVNPNLLAMTRQLRTVHTTAEGSLWGLLRNRQLLGCKFRRQHPIAPYVLDFYCAEAHLGIELDGG